MSPGEVAGRGSPDPTTQTNHQQGSTPAAASVAQTGELRKPPVRRFCPCGCVSVPGVVDDPACLRFADLGRRYRAKVAWVRRADGRAA